MGSCGKKPPIVESSINDEPEKILPFTSLDLTSLDSFKDVAANWKIKGDAYVDRSKKRALSGNDGRGILINLPEKEMNGNLFTAFEHGDIELEIDVMMPSGSNSGLYFQGRYEIQLLDSWGVNVPQHSDIGGIYQRWDDVREEGDKGYEGHAPKENAAKAPGLWQHFRILFHAPKFDSSGEKIENARFEEVWLNGVLLHENIEVTGPTRAAAYLDEKPLGPLMIQGDHGPVAFKNIQYKMYANTLLSFEDVRLKEFANAAQIIPNLDSLNIIGERGVEHIAMHEIDRNSQELAVYNGSIDIPYSGDYLFEMGVNGGALLLFAKDTILNLDGDNSTGNTAFKKVSLQKGKIPFALYYNKHNSRRHGLVWSVEGPQIQKYSLLLPNPVGPPAKIEEKILIDINDEPAIQRSFMMHGGTKRTHCVAVGNPEGIHFAYDLAFGSLLKVWSGTFLDVTQMWHSRGQNQLGVPQNMVVSMHGDLDFAKLKNQRSNWPDSLSTPMNFKQKGYQMDSNGVPTIQHQLGGSTISNTFVPSDSERSLVRVIETEGDSDIWHKVAEGADIKHLPDGTYIVNDESYFIDFPINGKEKPIIRENDGLIQLLVHIPSGNQKITYSIIW